LNKANKFSQRNTVYETGKQLSLEIAMTTFLRVHGTLLTRLQSHHRIKCNHNAEGSQLSNVGTLGSSIGPILQHGKRESLDI